LADDFGCGRESAWKVISQYTEVEPYDGFYPSSQFGLQRREALGR
jgi:hypothetical protein